MPEETMRQIIIICIVILVVILIAAIVTRLFRVAAIILVLMIVVPPIISIISGNGASHIEKISSFFVPEIRQQINDVYEDYSRRENDDPMLDEKGMRDALSGLWDKAVDAIGFSDEAE